MLLLFLSGKFLIKLLWGKEFLPAYIPMLLLFPGVLSISISKICSSIFHGKGKPEYGSLLSVISCSTMIPLDFLFIPRYGTIGAAAASSISYALSGITALIILHSLIKLEYKNILKIGLKDVLLFLKLK